MPHLLKSKPIMKHIEQHINEDAQQAIAQRIQDLEAENLRLRIAMTNAARYLRNCGQYAAAEALERSLRS